MRSEAEERSENAGMVVRPATVTDAGDLLGIERACAEAPHWSEAVWAQLLAQSTTHNPKSVVWGGVGQASAYGSRRCCLVAEHADEAVGFLVLSVSAGVGEIESVAVLEFARRHGVGRRLCVQAMLWSATQGAESLQLEVRASNTAALRLYAALGFVEQGRRRAYYRDPVEDAVLMAATLNGRGTESATV